MKYTNKHNLPDPIFQALTHDTYSRGKSDISVTELIDSPRIRLLKKAYADQIVVDAIDRVWSVFGTAIHKMIETGAELCAEEYISEERIFHDTGKGWVVSGAMDLQKIAEDKVEIKDWKTCSADSVMLGKRSWDYQLNIYAHLLEQERELHVTSLQIGAILKDWRRGKTFSRGYPNAPIVMVDIPLWEKEDREAFFNYKLDLHMGADLTYSLDGTLPKCTHEDMWAKADTWAVKKDGGVRALSLHQDRDEALAALLKAGGGHEIEHRPAVRLRCEHYCEVSEFCDQWKQHVAARDKDGIFSA